MGKWKRREHCPIHSLRPLLSDAKTRQGYYKKRKLQINISYEYQCKNLQQSIANRTQQHIKRIVVHYDQEEFIPRMRDWFKVRNQLK